MEGEFAEQVAAVPDVGVVCFQKSVAGGGGEGVVKIHDGAHGHVHGIEYLHTLAGVADTALANQCTFNEGEGLPGNAFKKRGEYAPFGLAFGEQHVIGEQKLVAVAKAE